MFFSAFILENLPEQPAYAFGSLINRSLGKKEIDYPLFHPFTITRDQVESEKWWPNRRIVRRVIVTGQILGDKMSRCIDNEYSGSVGIDAVIQSLSERSGIVVGLNIHDTHFNRSVNVFPEAPDSMVEMIILSIRCNDNELFYWGNFSGNLLTAVSRLSRQAE